MRSSSTLLSLSERGAFGGGHGEEGRPERELVVRSAARVEPQGKEALGSLMTPFASPNEEEAAVHRNFRSADAILVPEEEGAVREIEVHFRRGSQVEGRSGKPGVGVDVDDVAPLLQRREEGDGLVNVQRVSRRFAAGQPRDVVPRVEGRAVEVAEPQVERPARSRGVRRLVQERLPVSSLRQIGHRVHHHHDRREVLAALPHRAQLRPPLVAFFYFTPGHFHRPR
mmetsp:Transcript_11081/g.36636  ORF Transcript_11081/g.36636 Transcript_11081/m.36636 type:complete len:226 (+) Transcript_11081:493-1170(+)